MNAVKILGKFFAVIFASLFGVLLFLLILITFVKGSLNEVSFDEYISSEKIFNSKQEQLFKTNSGQTLKEQIGEELLKSGVPKETTYNILENKELDRILSEYTYNYMEYILFNEERPILSSEEIITFINLENSKLINNSLTLEQDEAINNYIIWIVNEVNESMPTVDDLENLGYDINFIQKISSIIFSHLTVILLILGLILMAIVIGICLWNKFGLFKAISIPTIIIGLILIFGAIMEVKFMNLLISSDGIIDGIILEITNETFKELLIYGISLVAIGLVILITIAVLSKLAKKQSFDFNQFAENSRSNVQEKLKNHIAISDEDIDKIDSTLTGVSKEIEMVSLPMEFKKIKEEELKIVNDSELPKVEISSEITIEKEEEIIPVKLNEPPKEETKNIENNKDIKLEENEIENKSDETDEKQINDKKQQEEIKDSQENSNNELKSDKQENSNIENKDEVIDEISEEEQKESNNENDLIVESEKSEDVVTQEQKQEIVKEEDLKDEKEQKEIENLNDEIEIIELDNEEQRVEKLEQDEEEVLTNDIEMLDDDQGEEIELLDEERGESIKAKNQNKEDIELL